MGSVPRPAGVAILAILGFLGSIITILVGIVGLVLSAFLSSFLSSLGVGGFASAIAGFAIALVSVGVLIAGLIYLLISWGLWAGKNWARIIWIIFSILGLLGAIGIIAGTAYLTGIISLIIDVLIIYYLTRPHVVAYFKGMPMQPMQPQMQQPPSK